MKPKAFKIAATNRKRAGMGIVARVDAIAAAHLDSSAKSLLVMLAKHLRAETAASGGVAWPSLKTLAAQAGMSEDTASRTMARLEKAGIVVTVSKAAQGRSARRAIDWTVLASTAPRMRVQESNLLKGKRSEDAGSSAPRMRVLGSASSEMQNPEARGGSVQVSVKESVQESVQAAREATTGPLSEDQPTESHTMPPDDLLTGSSPTKTDDPIDNGGDKAHPPEPVAPSLPIDEGDASTPSAASATTPATAPPAQDPWGVAPCGEPAQASAYIWLDKPEPAPKRTPKSKPKAKGKPDDAAILAIAAQVDRMKGRTGAALPGSGRWKMLVSAVNEAGADRVLARVTAMADAAQGLPSPAQAVFAQMSGSDWGTDPILRGNNGWTVKLDDAIEAAQSRSDASQDSRGVVGRLDPQNRSQGQTAPNLDVSWSEVLRDIGSDPQTHPEDGPHRHRWQSVRQAVIMAIRKPGDPWSAWCNADDHARQRVESLLERGLVK